MDPNIAAAKINQSLAESVAIKIKQGQILAETQARIGAEFPRWVSCACGVPLAEAELLIRWAADRPAWIAPAAVDLSDPLAWELMDLGLNRELQQMGIPITEAT
jgi:hypothetical protein